MEGPDGGVGKRSAPTVGLEAEVEAMKVFCPVNVPDCHQVELIVLGIGLGCIGSSCGACAQEAPSYHLRGHDSTRW